MASEQRDARGEYPLALAPGRMTVGPRDTLVLVLRSIVWTETNVNDIIRALDDVGLGGRCAILYLDTDDQALVVRGANG